MWTSARFGTESNTHQNGRSRLLRLFLQTPGTEKTLLGFIKKMRKMLKFGKKRLKFSSVGTENFV
jgi:hypothetical protein